MAYKNKPSIVIVDNHDLFRQAMSKYVPYAGYTVLIEATVGRHFLDQLRTAQTLPDVCFLDTDMPVMDGYQTAILLRRQYPAIKIIAMTTFEETLKKDTLLSNGADAFLSKSMPTEIWLEKIKEVFP